MSRSRIILIVSCAVIFASGMAVGYSFSRASMERRLDQLLSRASLDPESWLVATLQERLSLSEKQVAVLRAAYRETDTKRQVSRLLTRPTVSEPGYELMIELEKELTPSQRSNLSTVLDETWMMTRPPCFREIFPKLSLSMEQRQKFDLMLAQEAAKIIPLPASPESFCSSLLHQSAKASLGFLNPKQVAVLEQLAARNPE